MYESFLTEVKNMLEEKEPMTQREICLTVSCAFLSGLVLGMVFSPKKNIVLASNNCISANEEDGKKKKKKDKCCKDKGQKCVGSGKEEKCAKKEGKKFCGIGRKCAKA